LYVAATRARDHLVVSLHHSAKGTSGKSAAAVLWNASHESAAGWWRAASIGDQLALPVDVPSSGFVPMASDERDRWRRDQEALLTSAERRRVWAATAIASEVAAESAADDGAPVETRDTDDSGEPVEARDAGDDEPAAPPRPLHRGGTALGRAVHAVLQTVDLDDPREIAGLARVHAAVEGFAMPADVTEVERRAAGALESAVVREARAVPRHKRWREVYVAAPADGGLAGEQIVEGYIDLLFEDAGGDLVVVDYKTDRAASAEEAAAVAERYRLQAAAYAFALGAALHRRVARAVLVFCGRDGAIDHDIADLDRAVEEVRAVVAARV
jgi:ATP-dependent helicase/nuclease subunit A